MSRLVDRPAAWAVVLAIYVVLGVRFKTFVLNWIVGPTFPLLCLYVLPRMVRRRA